MAEGAHYLHKQELLDNSQDDQLNEGAAPAAPEFPWDDRKVQPVAGIRWGQGRGRPPPSARDWADQPEQVGFNFSSTSTPEVTGKVENSSEDHVAVPMPKVPDPYEGFTPEMLKTPALMDECGYYSNVYARQEKEDREKAVYLGSGGEKPIKIVTGKGKPNGYSAFLYARANQDGLPRGENDFTKLQDLFDGEWKVQHYNN